MKKTTKKSPSRASRKKTVKDLEVKPTKGGTVRGGKTGFNDIVITKKIDKSSPILFQEK